MLNIPARKATATESPVKTRIVVSWSVSATLKLKGSVSGFPYAPKNN
jgi:hypothetical protein